MIVGNNVTVDGKSSFSFAAQYVQRPILTIGDDTFIAHNTTITVGEQVTIGRHCYIATGASILELDAEPLAGQVELAFIDGAHALPYVINDTEKVAHMIKEEGMVLWHDYGGVGEFRPLSEYLENLARFAPVWRVPCTTTAWCMGSDLKRAIADSAAARRCSAVRYGSPAV